jgi:hypothetical protein
LKSLDALRRHDFVWKMHKPDSRPTEKQLASLLNATDKTAVGVDESIGGRMFIVGYYRSEPVVLQQTGGDGGERQLKEGYENDMIQELLLIAFEGSSEMAAVG